MVVQDDLIETQLGGGGRMAMKMCWHKDGIY